MHSQQTTEDAAAIEQYKQEVWHETVKRLYTERASNPSPSKWRDGFHDEFQIFFVDNISDLNRDKVARMLSVMGVPFVRVPPILWGGEKQEGCSWFFTSPDNRNRARKIITVSKTAIDW